ncbi:MAG: TetR/AcrR family transcriptional regulator [Hyphomicrobiaceae bacterium]|nr:TetR/AcrR family transcriptional regulator [Hyphomicrobiaceae bacterium]
MARRSDHTREELTRMALDAAHAITADEGLRGLRARQIARDIGYTIGTLYNLFEDFDDLILHMNGETLDALYRTCSEVELKGDPTEDLEALADRYLEFTRGHQQQWSAVFEHTLPRGRAVPDWYSEKVAKLMELEARALAPLFPGGNPDRIAHHARVLWTSLFGMALVESAERLPEGETARSLVRSLIGTYVAGLKDNRKGEL